MAYVGITDRLVGDIETKISDMQQKELEAFVPDWPRFKIHPRNPEVMQSLWGQYLHLESQIPDQWKDTCTYVTFKFPDVTVRTEAAKDMFREMEVDQLTAHAVAARMTK